MDCFYVNRGGQLYLYEQHYETRAHAIGAAFELWCVFALPVIVVVKEKGQQTFSFA